MFITLRTWWTCAWRGAASWRGATWLVARLPVLPRRGVKATSVRNGVRVPMSIFWLAAKRPLDTDAIPHFSTTVRFLKQIAALLVPRFTRVLPWVAWQIAAVVRSFLPKVRHPGLDRTLLTPVRAMHPGGRPQDRRLAPQPTRSRLTLRASSLRSNNKERPPDQEGDRHPIGAVVIRRWFNPCAEPVAHRTVPRDVRLGLFADRMTPALAKVNGRLATDLTQQSALDMRSDRFAVRPEINAYRRSVAAIASAARPQHDQPEIDSSSSGSVRTRNYKKSCGLSQLNRDGLFVQPPNERDPLRNNALFFSSRKLLHGKDSASSKPFRRLGLECNPIRTWHLWADNRRIFHINQPVELLAQRKTTRQLTATATRDRR